uniref:Uncharacterized protein n=1 Tax=Strombidium rassoulzadegani TaxID=1082188 RepID=A0A7S3CJS6_9SPIT|mmetsp:Transcript_13542/g.23054  ORF Transcript_13542/g.23054 Transcript_13542/m.23054 type:complete len:191 (+) Transcript_13542:65-637(+)
MLIFCFMMIASNMFQYKLVYFFYYVTLWGLVTTTLAILASIKAAKYRAWQKTAVISGQFALALNLTITPTFWLFLAPIFYPAFPWTFMGIFTRVSMFTVHTLPLFFSLTNIHLTDMQLIEADYKRIILLGMSYTIANGIGTYMIGMPIYPIADWKNVPLTIFLYCLNGLIMGLLYKLAAKYVNNHLPFNK